VVGRVDSTRRASGQEEAPVSAVVVLHHSVDSSVGDGRRLRDVRHVLRHHVPGRQVQKVDYVNGRLVRDVSALHSAHQGLAAGALLRAHFQEN